jgi:hypothetical protein
LKDLSARPRPEGQTQNRFPISTTSSVGPGKSRREVDLSSLRVALGDLVNPSSNSGIMEEGEEVNFNS